MSFENLKSSIKTHVKYMLNDIKYGDDSRKPLEYIPTLTTEKSFYFVFPLNTTVLSFKSTSLFPELSRVILINLFKGVGIKFVPEITLYYLKEKTPFEVFENFCLTFGTGVEDRIVDIDRLNEVVLYLKKMDSLRENRLFNSKPIYTALANRDFEKANRLIEKRIIDDKNAI